MRASWTRSERLKRAMDVGLALALLILSVPLLGLVALASRLLTGPPVLFRQVRAGRRGRPFEMLKLRTMRDGDAPDEERLTRFGRALRASSLDELPELWNVLRGDMSLVGPRPLPMRYLDRYTPDQARRHEVKPGITGWAQVNGRNALRWPDKLARDVWYVDHWSLGLDVRILALTAGQVLRRTGIHARGCATMPEFMGQPGAEGNA